MKKRSSFLVFSFLFSFFVIGGLFWWGRGFLPVNSQSEEKIYFVVNRGDGFSSVADSLKKAGLIRSATHFKITGLLQKTAGKIKAGGYYLSFSMKEKEIAEMLTKGVDDLWVTVVEGLRSEEIGQFLIKKGLAVNPQKWAEQIKNQNLEGRLFPDSYLMPRGADQEKILAVFEKNFTKKITTGLSGQIKNSDLKLDEILILASILEREAKTDKDRRLIAGILLKRIENAWPLQVDATVQYAVGSQSCTILISPCDWWPSKTTYQHLEIISPYNSYLHKGLPPAPICNPGLSSIKAVLEAEPSLYWYYLSGKDGIMRFAKTADEHQANIQKFLR